METNPKAYQSALRHLSVEPTRCAMVAAHEWDLRGASAVGLRTVYVPRLGEGSPRADVKTKVDGGEVDIVIRSFEELAGLLAAAEKE
ncbi:hypothetical protein C0993_005533 [Termitomyces sp. T159_Od127]|nr:hypothetical protein C0993_005533 [Termitomyces sp. T159_Od127]